MMENITDYTIDNCKEYPYTPSIIPKKSRIIAFGDIHGDYNLAIQLLLLAKVIYINSSNNAIWIGQDTVVVQVGDQIDRCRPPAPNVPCTMAEATPEDEDSDVKILKLFTNLDIQARKHGGMVISLLGNHELMNSTGRLEYVSRKGLDGFGGWSQRFNSFKPGNEYGKFLACTRLSSVIIGSNLFVHAGIINKIMEHFNIHKQSDLKTINATISNWLLALANEHDIDEFMKSRDSIFWTRVLGSLPSGLSYDDSRCISQIDKVLKIFKVNSLIIGHTPQVDGINSTCDNRVWRVDVGSSKAFDNRDNYYLQYNKRSHSRRPQVLEILNDNEFRIIG